ncbi:MAG: type II toxin-antitoxin system VapC family toxin [Terracidiphilus sp.]|nr:type II toxin-antitoxin system VapC family toxin [Terracidiphilus sp.]
MKIAADTNVLLRDALQDDSVQSRLARKVLESAELVVIPVPVLCEFVWVLRQAYKRPALEIANSIRVLMDSSNVVMNQPAVEAGLAVLDKGGDFADGAIAYEGHWLGAEEFVSFDKQAVSLLRSQGKQARLLS